MTWPPVDQVAAAVREARFSYADEDRLQAGVALVLAAAFPDCDVRREVPLDAHSRIDLIVGRIGVEVKVAGSTSAVLRQVTRYLNFDLLAGLVLVTNRVRHLRLPSVVCAKPVAVVTVVGGSL